MRRYPSQDIAAIYRVIAERRDMRHFLPDPVDPAVLGHVEAFYPAPMLELQGWTQRRALEDLVFHNTWGHRETPP